MKHKRLSFTCTEEEYNYIQEEVIKNKEGVGRYIIRNISQNQNDKSKPYIVDKLCNLCDIINGCLDYMPDEKQEEISKEVVKLWQSLK